MIKQAFKLTFLLIILFSMLCGCVKQQNQPVPDNMPTTNINKKDKLIELTETESAYLLNIFESKPEIQNQAGSTGSPVVLEITNDSVKIFVDSLQITPLVTIKIEQDQWRIQYFMNQRRDFHYDHPDESDRLAYLSTEYYVNPFDSSLPDGVLICTLDVPESEEFDTFRFTYDETEMKMMNSNSEEIVFTKDLREKVTDYCESFLDRNRSLKECLDITLLEAMRWIESHSQIVIKEETFEFDDEQMKYLSQMFLECSLLQEYARKGPYVQTSSNTIMIEAGSREIPTMVMRKENGIWTMERYYNYYDIEITYSKQKDDRKAYLKADYYINYPGDVKQNVLECRLETPYSYEKQGYNFTFDQENQLFIDLAGDSITFTKELHDQLLILANEIVKDIKELDEQMMSVANEVIQLVEDGLEVKYEFHQTDYRFVSEGIDVYKGVKGINLLMASEEIIELNQKLAQQEKELLAMKDVGENFNNLADEDWSTIALRDILSSLKQDVLSLLVIDQILRNEQSGTGPITQVYNIDLKKEKLLTNQELCDRINLNPSKIAEKMDRNIQNRNCKVENVPGCLNSLSIENLNDWKIAVLNNQTLAIVLQSSEDTAVKDHIYFLEIEDVQED